MKELRKQIEILLEKTDKKEEVLKAISKEKLIFPFSLENSKLAFLLGNGILSYEEYVTISKEYSKRNKYLELYDMAPRTFGQTWGEAHILKLFPEFIGATKESVEEEYREFDGEFDLWLDGSIRVEVKACRANAKGKGSLASRAYLHKEAEENSFKYHFQQLKPTCCDVFIWIGVCRDKLIYWVLTSQELHETKKLGPQHRNENTKVEGVEVFEGQVFMTEEELETFFVEEKDILSVVRRKGKEVVKNK